MAVRAFLRAAEATTLDAFPSGHTALSLVPAALGTRLFPRWAPLLWTWAGAVIFATVYIQVHYVVDVVAGGVLGLVALAVAPGAPAGHGGSRRGPGPRGQGAPISLSRQSGWTILRGSPRPQERPTPGDATMNAKLLAVLATPALAEEAKK